MKTRADLLSAALALAACAPSRRERCLRASGRWVEVDCRLEKSQSCVDVPVGNDLVIPICTVLTDVVCSHACLGASPEAP